MNATPPRALRNFVDGEYRDPRSELRSDVVDPTTARVIATAPVSSAEDVDDAFRAAARAEGRWRDTTPAERQLALLRLADADQVLLAKLALRDQTELARQLAAGERSLPQAWLSERG